MASSKGKRAGPPLFELLQGNRFRRGDAAPQPNLRVVNPEPDDDDGAPQANTVRLAEPDQAPDLLDKPRALNLSGDRLHLSLTPLTAAIGVFAISLLVLGAIALGQRRGEKSGFLRAISESSTAGEIGDPDAIESLRRQPPASHLVESLLANDAKAAPAAREADRASRKAQLAASGQAQTELPAGPQHGWVRDYTYIVTQEFAAGRAQDARRAQEFLAARDFSAEIITLDSGAIQLITLEGYNHKDPAQKRRADEILKKQRAVGVEYFASGGGYKLEGYYKTLKKDQW